jgi:hypothetical protein
MRVRLGLLSHAVCFIVATSGGGVFDVVNLVIESDHLKQTHCADHVKQCQRTERHPDHLFNALGQFGYSAGGIIDRL